MWAVASLTPHPIESRISPPTSRLPLLPQHTKEDDTFGSESAACNWACHKSLLTTWYPGISVPYLSTDEARCHPPSTLKTPTQHMHFI